MLPGIPADPNERVTSADGQRQIDHRVEIKDAKQLVETGRHLLRENPHLTEAEFRNLMFERFRANDQRLQQDKANLTASPGHGTADGLFALFMLPWTVFRWLGWRGRRARRARHCAEMDEVVRVVRGEGHFASAPA